MDVASAVRLFILAALWGGSFLFMRIASPALGAIPTAFARVLLGALGLMVLVLVLRVARSFNGRFTATLVLGAINSAIPFLMFSIAARVLPAGYSAILNATAPLMAVVIGAMLFGERITSLKGAGVLIGFTGVVVLTRAGTVDLGLPVLLGVGACLVATACYALGGFLTKRIADGLDSRLVALGSQCGAVVMLAPFMAWDASQHAVVLASVDARVWISLLGLGLLCTSVAYVLYFRLIADVGPMKALTVTFLIPVFAVFWAWLILDEPASLAHVVGGGLIAVALWMVLHVPSSQAMRNAPSVRAGK
jgi:drug/metabolite transporter (DMT)-like permease